MADCNLELGEIKTGMFIELEEQGLVLKSKTEFNPLSSDLFLFSLNATIPKTPDFSFDHMEFAGQLVFPDHLNHKLAQKVVDFGRAVCKPLFDGKQLLVQAQKDYDA